MANSDIHDIDHNVESKNINAESFSVKLLSLN